MTDNTKRLLFTPIQAQAIVGANNVNKTVKKYVENLSQKIIELSNQSANLRKEADSLDTEARNINNEIISSEKEAQKQYKETLKLVISQFDTPPPPWKAVVILEKGVPIGVDLQQEE